MASDSLRIFVLEIICFIEITAQKNIIKCKKYFIKYSFFYSNTTQHTTAVDKGFRERERGSLMLIEFLLSFSGVVWMWGSSGENSYKPQINCSVIWEFVD